MVFSSHPASYWQPGDGDDTLKFTPTSSGWYRILEGSTNASGAIRIESDYSSALNADADVEFSYYGDIWGSGGIANAHFAETRQGRIGSGIVDQVRVVTEPSSSGGYVWLDVHVPNVTGIQVIRCSVRGPMRGICQYPVLAAPAPDSSSLTNLFTL